MHNSTEHAADDVISREDGISYRRSRWSFEVSADDSLTSTLFH